ncbi:acid phosphatase [Fibrella aestuarina BUZ 2]|uniref:acid phosphatase n=1 Tax=Fibrella aestuarina BUZ 2 TaxID=1166018 RepID=I0KC66_9BACT|nr:tartrate-resistant acid phosphatase type 5 family protein [Fibrella aestuarina]CCH01719.1 acid phosphatase [Fibrella aestuarina BUZ 2]
MRSLRPPLQLLLLFLVFVSRQAQAQRPADYSAQLAAGYELGVIPKLQTLDKALHFAVVGDWGRQGEFHQRDVALQMAKAMAGLGGSFIISTGDNFYPSGVRSTQDPLWQGSFEQIYHYAWLQRDWYAILGNHDYAGNVEAQIDYSKISRRWHMPARYYSLKKKLAGNGCVQFVFLDTNGLEPDYYTNDELAPALSQQDTTAQLRWLRETLSDPDPTIRWRIVVGHHPVYTAGKRTAITGPVRRSLEPILNQYNVDLYICGHDHDLQYNKPAGPTHHFLSGAGSELSNVPHKTPENVFYRGVNGFMTFSVQPTQFLVQIIDGKGAILFSRLIPKS